MWRFPPARPMAGWCFIPTPRAITERLGKMKAAAKANGGSPSASSSRTMTPRKRRAGNPQTPSSKHKLEQNGVQLETVDNESRLAKRGYVKQESTDFDLTIDLQNSTAKSPSKRARTSLQPPQDMVEYRSDDENGLYESSASEHVSSPRAVKTENDYGNVLNGGELCSEDYA